MISRILKTSYLLGLFECVSSTHGHIGQKCERMYVNLFIPLLVIRELGALFGLRLDVLIV